MVAEPKDERIAANIRVFVEADAAAATEILRTSPEAAQWTELGFRELLGWRGVLAFVLEEDKRILGFVVGRQVAQEAEILNLAVHLLRRRKGEGAELLKAAMQELRGRQVRRVFLEVRESNAAAIAFYTKHGFYKTGSRAGYYRNPEEAAVVMERKLTG
jgi:ribosomal-protein-alanine N-acetyltransferase